jgi:hypothetical protein
VAWRVLARPEKLLYPAWRVFITCMALVPWKRYHGVVTTQRTIVQTSEPTTNELAPVHPRHGDSDFRTRGAGKEPRETWWSPSRAAPSTLPPDPRSRSNDAFLIEQYSIHFIQYSYCSAAIYQSIGNWPHAKGGQGNGADREQGLQRITTMRKILAIKHRLTIY